MSKITEQYTASDRLRDIIDDNPLMLLVISRFSIPFGFGDATVGEVCKQNDVHTPTFLAVANLIAKKTYANYDIDPNSLISYLKKAHSHFLDRSLPAIRRKLVEALYSREVNDISFLILKYFDDYAVEVRAHMEYENDHLFTYVANLSEGKSVKHFSLKHYSANHTDMADKLNELKDIIIRHYRRNDDSHLLNTVLYDIINTQNDLISHCSIENNLLVPAVYRLEKNRKENTNTTDESNAMTPPTAPEALGDREKEIIVLVAKGFSNKEIANRLCLSINTVTTHRRNIAAKLQIHSPAGLTIYAIMHKLLDIKDIKFN